MTSEQRLDRLERIAKLMVRAGVRGRQTVREQQVKINIIIDAQVRTEELLDRLAATTAEQARSQAERIEQLSQTTAEQSLIQAEAHLWNQERFDQIAQTTAGQARIQAKAQLRTNERFEQVIQTIADQSQIQAEAQIKNEERFAKMAKAQATMADAQTHTDQKLDILIDIIRKNRNGKSKS